MPKISGLPPDTSPANGDYLPILNSAGAVTNKVTVQNLLALAVSVIYPIGAIYTETTGTNPNTTFGFGTWTQVGGGQVLVGQTSSDSDFATGGNTGGEKFHTLSINEMPNHGHGVSDPGHAHGTAGNYFQDAGGAGNLNVSGGGDGYARSANVGVYGSGTGIGIQGTGGGAGHNNMPPYLVVYFWKRTA